MRTILLVSDASWVHNDVSASVDMPGSQVVVEEDPRTVTQSATLHTPDVYLVDMQVGSMGGMAITRQLREAIHAETIPSGVIVMLLDREADAFIAKRSGADAWVVKPFTAQQLRATIGTAQPAQA